LKPNHIDLLIILPSPNIGGTELQALHHATEITSRGYKVLIVFLSEGSGNLLQSLKDKKLNFKVLSKQDSGDLKPQLKSVALFKLCKLIHITQPKVINAFLIESFILALIATKILFLNSLLLKGSARRIFCSIRGSARSRSKSVEFVVSLLLAKSTRVIVNSPHLLEEVSQRYKLEKSKISIVLNGVIVPVSRVRSVKNIDTLYIANFLPYKGHRQFLEEYFNHGQTFSVKFIGQGEERASIESLVLHERYGSRILVSAESEKIHNYLNSAQIAIHPSLTEGLSNSILEYLSFGLPVVAFDVGGNNLVIKDSYNGYLVPSGDYISFFDRVNELLVNDELRARLSSNALKTFLNSDFDWETNTKHLLKLYGFSDY
jgi:glycosyltransferase involved in cell wall biosynthesis